MLVLSRKACENIIIGHGDDAITISVVEIRGDKVRLGIVAPRNVPVHRQEVYDLIHGHTTKPEPDPITPYPSAEAAPSPETTGLSG